MDLGLVDPAYKNLTPEARHEIVKEIEEACYATGGEKVISVSAQEYDSFQESVVLTSNGFQGAEEATVYWAGARMAIQDEGDRRPNGYNYLAAVTKEGLPAPAEIGEVAAQRTLDLLGGKKLKTETLPVIIENRNVSRLLGGFLAAMYGRNIQQNQSFLKDKKE